MVYYSVYVYIYIHIYIYICTYIGSCWWHGPCLLQQNVHVCDTAIAYWYVALNTLLQDRCGNLYTLTPILTSLQTEASKFVRVAFVMYVRTYIPTYIHTYIPTYLHIFSRQCHGPLRWAPILLFFLPCWN